MLKDWPSLRKSRKSARLPGPPAALEVRAVGRARHRREHHPFAADLEVAGRVAGVHGELGPAPWPRHPGPARGRRAPAARRPRAPAALIDVARLGQQHVHPDLFQDGQRRLVDALELVGRDQVDRRQQVARLLERQLGDVARHARRAPPAPLAASARRLNRAHAKAYPSVASEILAEPQRIVDRRMDVAARHRVADPEQLVARRPGWRRSPAAGRPAGHPGRSRHGCASRP